MAESDVCASVVNTALMTHDVISSRPGAALLLNNIYDKYTCVCTQEIQHHMAPVLCTSMEQAQDAAAHINLAVLILAGADHM